MKIRVNDINVHGYWEFVEITIMDNVLIGRYFIGRELQIVHIPTKDILKIEIVE